MISSHASDFQMRLIEVNPFFGISQCFLMRGILWLSTIDTKSGSSITISFFSCQPVNPFKIDVFVCGK